jgi:hypothetical protein
MSCHYNTCAFYSSVPTATIAPRAAGDAGSAARSVDARRVAENARHIANAVHAALGSAGTKASSGQRSAFKPPESELYPSLTSTPASSCRIPVATWAGERSGA